MRPLLVALVALLGAALPAQAHPHVWITARAEILYAPDGRIAGLRHAWTFDEAYSAYVTQGLDADKDGKLTAAELQELAQTNTTSLLDFEYFTVLKANGTKQVFGEPRAPAMSFENGRVTLSFELPLKAPAAAGRALALEVYDGTYFVDFRFADGDDAVRLAGAPKGCAVTLNRPKPAAAQQPLSEAFFEALTSSSGYGALQATRVLAACP